MKIKKLFTIVIMFVLIIPQCVIPISGKAETVKNSEELDISKGWTIDYVPDFQPLVDAIFLQNNTMSSGTVKGVLVQAGNIGNATLTAQKVIPMKKGHAYDLDLIYAQYYTNGGSGYIDFNGEKIIATTDSADHEYKKTIIPTSDMSYKITISFINKYAGNAYVKLGYNLEKGGIVDKQAAVNVHDSNLYVGDTWKAEDNFDSALDNVGNTVALSQITIDSSKVDTTKAGTYNVTYTYDGVTSTAKVTVKDRQTAVNVHDSNLYVGDSWKAQDNFDSALDKDGNAIDFSKVTVDDSKVDTTKSGAYDVTYSYDGVTSTAKVTVKDKQTAVNVHDSNLYVGDTWKSEDNFDSALDKDGNPIDFSKVTVDDSKVDTTKAGTYDVTYTYDGVTSTAKITVEVNSTHKSTPKKSINNDKASGKKIAHKNNENTKSSVSKKTLPQTGDCNDKVLTLTGLASMALLGLAAFLKRREIKK